MNKRGEKQNGLIGTLNEKSLHEEVKNLYLKNEAKGEVKVAGLIVDVVTSKNELIEIQTSGFYKIKHKLDALLRDYAVKISKERYELRREIRNSEFRNGGDV